MPEKKETIAKKAAEKEKKETVIYLGPTIPGIIATATILNNGKPKKLEALEKELPAISLLIVKMEDVVQARRDLKTEGTPMNICYNEVEKYRKGKGE